MGRICAFTGHRTVSRIHVNSLMDRLDGTIESLIADGYTDFRTGGALGFDTLAALKIIEKKKKYGYIRLHLCLPCHAQDKGWDRRSKDTYSFIMENADTVRYSSEEYTRGCMHKRNREMMDGADICVAYHNGSQRGGTAYTVGYAAKKGIRIVNLFQK